MAEYIERGALLNAYDAAHKGEPGGARKLIADAPSADVAPVVRCGDCSLKYMNGDEDIVCGRTGVNVDADDFCSYGERRGDG